MKKGFTIVELVIVIAVIAILAAVLIPTFSNVIAKADQSALLQKAKAKFEEAYALDLADGTLDGKENGTAISDTGYSVSGTGASAAAGYTLTEGSYKAVLKDGKWTVGNS